MTAQWQPLFTGERAEVLLRVALDIAQSVAELPEGGPPSLSGGSAGIALFHAYLDRAVPHRGFDDVAGRFISDAYLCQSQCRHNPGLYSGWTGVGYSIEHLSGIYEADGDDRDDPLDELDDRLLALLRRPAARPQEYDLVSGYVGMGVYALERLPRTKARDALSLILEHLSRISKSNAHGLSWHHAPELLPLWVRPNYPKGWHNLGLAHGMPGIVGLLCRIIAAGVEVARSRQMLEALLRWILAQRLPEDANRYFPSIIGERPVTDTNRSAWCYGDPGVAITLLAAGRALNEQTYQDLAIEMMRDVSSRPMPAHGVKDAMICHGAIGLAHLFNRFYQATGIDSFGEQARHWVDRALAYRTGGRYGGFRSYVPNVSSKDPQLEEQWRDDAGFLTGSTGLGLVLLATCTHCEPLWDQVLLTSVKGTPATGGA